MIGFIWIIGLILTFKNCHEIWNKCQHVEKTIAIVLIVLTSWLGLLSTTSGKRRMAGWFEVIVYISIFLRNPTVSPVLMFLPSIDGSLSSVVCASSRAVTKS